MNQGVPRDIRLPMRLAATDTLYVGLSGRRLMAPFHVGAADRLTLREALRSYDRFVVVGGPRHLMRQVARSAQKLGLVARVGIGYTIKRSNVCSELKAATALEVRVVYRPKQQPEEKHK